MSDTWYLNTWDTEPHGQLFTHLRIPVSVGDFLSPAARLGSGLIERFTEPTRGDIYMGLGFGLPSICTIIWAKGGGRKQLPGEPVTATGFGTYLGGDSYEGGVRATATWLFKRAAEGWPIVAVELGNEEPLPWDEYKRLLMLVIRLRNTIAPHVGIIAGYGLTLQGWERMRSAAPLLDPDKGDGIGPHLLNSRSFAGDLRAARILAQDHGLHLLPTEHRPLQGRFYRDSLYMIEEASAACGQPCVPAFPSGINPWGDPDNNGKLFAPPYALYTNGERTRAADIWEEFAVGEPPAPEVDVPGAIRIINRQVEVERGGWVKGHHIRGVWTPREPIRPNATVTNLLEKLGVVE